MKTEDRQKRLEQLAAERNALTAPIATQRIAPNLVAEGYDTKRGFIEKSTGKTFFLRIAADEEIGLNRRVYCLKNELHYHQVDEADFKKLFERA
jgi:hypothetical protein